MEDTQDHICGRCNQHFGSEADYIAHTCPETGFTPADPEHQGAEFAEVQKYALERGKERLSDPAAIAKQEAAIAEVQQTIDNPAEEAPALELREDPEIPEAPADEKPPTFE